MSYSSVNGRKPNEYASKSAHSSLINDQEINNYLTKCKFPVKGENAILPSENIIKVDKKDSKIKYVVAVDGGYDTVSTIKDYPSATVSFFQFGALMFKVEDLEAIEKQNFIQPSDMQKLKKMERLKLAIPTRYITYGEEKNLTDSVRKTLYEFFMMKPKPQSEMTSNFMKTLSWLVYAEYLKRDSNNNFNGYSLSSCPSCGEKNVPLKKEEMRSDYTFICKNTDCRGVIYLTDIMRLHESIDDEIGATGILGYITTSLEQFVILDLIRTIYSRNKQLLRETLFLKDGPLAFFGTTARLHVLVRRLLNFLKDENVTINLVGIEKSGVFVEHANQIKNKLEKGSIFMLSNEYIYGNIYPSKDSNDIYASTSYYSGKLIYKTTSDQMFVITVPTGSAEIYLQPNKESYMNLDNILDNLPKLRCDMYDNALFPIALANKLVSLSSHPSSTILEAFLKEMTVNN